MRQYTVVFFSMVCVFFQCWLAAVSDAKERPSAPLDISSLLTISPDSMVELEFSGEQDAILPIPGYKGNLSFVKAIVISYTLLNIRHISVMDTLEIITSFY